jgi:hypothetical protein
MPTEAMNVVDLQREIETSTPPTFVGAVPAVLPLITGYVGGTSSDLDSVDTTHLWKDTDIPFLIRVDGAFIPVYLETGAADVTDPGQIQPLDDPNVHWSRGA